MMIGALLMGMSFAGCANTGPSYGTFVRGADEPVIDQPAMSTGLDKRDLEKMFRSLQSTLFRSDFYHGLRDRTPTATVAVLPMVNDTSEHIDRQLDALLAKVETAFVGDGGFGVVSRGHQAALIDELNNQQSDYFDPDNAARLGRLVGAEFVVMGKVFDAAERTDDMRRVQYMAFMQVIEVETGIVMWQDETDVTKAYVAGW